ncbi:MAG: hypothetical protein ACYS6K_11405 [Planctomycetota bacterium]|jgi:hypothetical protein
MKRAILTLLSVIVFCNVVSGYEREVSWIDGNEPPEFSVSPADPTTSDLIYFTIPTDIYPDQSTAEEILGGTPTLSIDPNTRTIKLRFQQPPPAHFPGVAFPVSGLEGHFGPLEEGIWLFDVQFTGTFWSVDIVVVPGSGKANFPYPDNGDFDISQSLVLRWSPGYDAILHDVYFGTNLAAVASGDPSTYRGNMTFTSFSPGLLERSTTYYWRIDELSGPPDFTVFRGDVWSFTTAGYTVNDGFDSFDDVVGNRIFDIWRADPDSGAIVGYTDPPHVETTILIKGKQSMPFSYDNTIKSYSVATRDYAPLLDWTLEDDDFLVVYVHGRPGNDPDRLYIEIKDIDGRSARVFNSDLFILVRADWTGWWIPLSEFTEANANVDLSRIQSVSIGAGNPPPLNGEMPVPPGGLINDYCFDAIPISGNITNAQFDTTDCQYDGPEPEICMHSPNIWYCYTAQRTCNVTVSLCDSSFDTMLAIYKGCGCYPRQSDLIECNDDACGQQSEITFFAYAGNKYLIEVGGWFDAEWGPGVLNIHCDNYLASSIVDNDIKLLDQHNSNSNGDAIVGAIVTVGTSAAVLRGRVYYGTVLESNIVFHPEFSKISPGTFTPNIFDNGTYSLFLLNGDYEIIVEKIHDDDGSWWKWERPLVIPQFDYPYNFILNRQP